MTDANDSSDRHDAPEGRRKGVTQLILITSLIAALCFIAYLLLFNKKTNEANAAERQAKKAPSQLHTASTTFEMPVFKKPELLEPEPLPVTEVIVEPEPIPEIKLEPLPQPEPLPMPEVIHKPEPLAKTVVVPKSQPVIDKPISDEERRLGGGVLGAKGLPTLANKQSVEASNRAGGFGADSGYSGARQGRKQVKAEAPFILSEYEYKEGQTLTPKSDPSSELTSKDIDRLGQLAALYGVSEDRNRRSTYRAKPSSVSNNYSSQPLAVASPSDDSPTSSEEDERGLRYQPINQTSSTRPTGQGGGIDLSSTQVVGTQAKRIKLDYLLKRGTYIGCVLKTRIVSDQAGFISCTVTENIYSADGSNLLLPRGSDVLGEYKPKSLSNGKVRLQAVWDAVTTPDGIRVNLGSPSTGRLGAAGIGGQINNHYGQKVGIPILLSLFRTAIDYRTRNYSGESGEYKRTGSDAADDVLSDQMQQYEEIRPTLTKHQGSTIGIMVARDVSFDKVLAGSR